MAYGAILNQKPQKGILPEIIITPLSTLTSVTATSSTGKVYNGIFGNGVWTITVDDFDIYTISGVGTSETTEVMVNVCKQYEIVFPAPSGSLNDNSWAAIRYASDNNLGESLWSVGDTKAIEINGTIGTVNFNNYSTYVFILGFNHNEALEGKGITFGGFKSALSGGKDICLIDSKYDSPSTDGTKYFNMNHSSNTNSGGWKGCDLRYDVLGSTNTNDGDATTTTATSPVSGTLMAALPSELRAVMKPMTIYTDNTGGGTNTASDVTSSVDYLPLLAEYEIFGTRSYANSAEQNYQAQYVYYSAGNSKVKYRHSATSSTASWWERSPLYSTSNAFCFVTTVGNAYYYSARDSYGLAPAFRV